jgi:hypothetical protein
MQFNLLLMPPKKASTQQPKIQMRRIMKNSKLTGIPTTRGHKYPTRNCVSQKNTTRETGTDY